MYLENIVKGKGRIDEGEALLNFFFAHTDETGYNERFFFENILRELSDLLKEKGFKNPIPISVFVDGEVNRVYLSVCIPDRYKMINHKKYEKGLFLNIEVDRNDKLVFGAAPLIIAPNNAEIIFYDKNTDNIKYTRSQVTSNPQNSINGWVQIAKTKYKKIDGVFDLLKELSVYRYDNKKLWEYVKRNFSFREGYKKLIKANLPKDNGSFFNFVYAFALIQKDEERFIKAARDEMDLILEGIDQSKKESARKRFDLKLESYRGNFDDQRQKIKETAGVLAVSLYQNMQWLKKY